MNKGHFNLLIATPGHSMMASYVKSLLHTMQFFAEKGISIAFLSEYSSHVANAREATLNGGPQNVFNESRPLNGEITYDKILWIDSDISWNPEDALKLYESDKDIVSGAYLLSNGEVTAYPKLLQAAIKFDELEDKKELIEIEGAGFGFICFKKGVFESLSRPWFQSVPITMTDPESKKEYTFPIQGEDISLCKRALDAGFKLWLDPTVKVIHNKTMRLTWDGPRS